MEQQTIPVDPAINRVPRGLRTPRAFVQAVLESDRGFEYGVENWASEYAEPGYDDPARGILFGNWNDPAGKWNGKSKPKRFAKIAEYAGYTIEWYDEWSTCDDCGRALRTSPDSYSWQSSYIMPDNCSIVCHDCADWGSYLESIEDNPSAAVVRACDPSEHGYELYSDPSQYESGWHPGQTDDPRAILESLHARGITGIVFRIPETSQFYIRFEVWRRIPEETE